MSQAEPGLLHLTTRRVVNALILGIGHGLCRIEASELRRVPPAGPLILVTNHINFLDIPLLYTLMQPRPLTGLVKHETWNDPLLGPLFSLWQAIPIRRGEPDLKALRTASAALQSGSIVAVAPEGTRSGDGRLQHAHPGVITLAQMSGAPLLPVAFWGIEQFRTKVRRLQRAEFQVRVGSPLTLAPGLGRLDKAARQAAADELMGYLASLLPQTNRGVYDGSPPGERRFFDLV